MKHKLKEEYYIFVVIETKFWLYKLFHTYLIKLFTFVSLHLLKVLLTAENTRHRDLSSFCVDRNVTSKTCTSWSLHSIETYTKVQAYPHVSQYLTPYFIFLIY